jgi:glycerol-3-phosphate dehydrogenase
MESGATHEFEAPRIINAAGPWNRDLAERFDRDFPGLFLKRLLNWNVLFDRKALSSHSLGLTSSNGKEHTYFFHNWKNRMLVGTGELLVEAGEDECRVPAEAMDRFIRDINSTVPGLEIRTQDILRTYSGVLPAREDGRLAVRETFVDHSASGGPQGLFTISGVKYTTARLVADKTLKKIYPENRPVPHKEMNGFRFSDEAFFEYQQQPDGDDLDRLKQIVALESVIHLSDLVLRRTSLGDNPRRIESLLKKIRPLFPWDDGRWKQEIDRLESEMHRT